MLMKFELKRKILRADYPSEEHWWKIQIVNDNISECCTNTWALKEMSLSYFENGSRSIVMDESNNTERNGKHLGRPLRRYGREWN